MSGPRWRGRCTRSISSLRRWSGTWPWSPRGAILLEGPESEELTSPFPAGVTLRGWELKDGVVTVDFSARYAALSGVALTLADYSVVDTLCQLETVDAVEITADGDRLTYRDHQRMTASDAWTLEEIEAEEP